METTSKMKETLKSVHRDFRFKTNLASVFFILSFFFAFTTAAYAHCDSYDGPVVKDALHALETNNVNLVLKWIEPGQEEEIISLFNKTRSLRNRDQEVYAIVEKHFLETLVRLHRETEGAPYTGLKQAGETKRIIQLSDQSIEDDSFDDLIMLLNNHLDRVLREKYEKVSSFSRVKDESTEKGRKYVAAYVDYTHTIEAIHDLIENEHGHQPHNH